MSKRTMPKDASPLKGRGTWTADKIELSYHATISDYRVAEFPMYTHRWFANPVVKIKIKNGRLDIPQGRGITPQEALEDLISKL